MFHVITASSRNIPSKTSFYVCVMLTINKQTFRRYVITDWRRLTSQEQNIDRLANTGKKLYNILLYFSLQRIDFTIINFNKIEISHKSTYNTIICLFTAQSKKKKGFPQLELTIRWVGSLQKLTLFISCFNHDRPKTTEFLSYNNTDYNSLVCLEGSNFYAK